MEFKHVSTGSDILLRKGSRAIIIEPKTGQLFNTQQLEAGKIYKLPTQKHGAFGLENEELDIGEVVLEELTQQGEPMYANGRPIAKLYLHARVVMGKGIPYAVRVKTFNTFKEAIENISETTIEPMIVKRAAIKQEIKEAEEDYEDIEDKVTMKGGKARSHLKSLQEKLRELQELEKLTEGIQTEVMEGVNISEIETIGHQISFKMHFDQLPVKVAYRSSDKCSDLFTTIIPTGECTVKLVANLQNGSILVKREDKNHQNAAPHLSDYVCMGDYEGTFIELIKKRDMGSLVNMFLDFMTTYYSGSPLWTPVGPFSYQERSPSNILGQIYTFGNKRISVDRKEETITFNEMREHLTQEVKDEMTAMIAHIRKLHIPEWAKQKTGFNNYFDVIKIDKKFAEQNYLEASFYIESFDELNGKLFTLIN